MAPGANDTTITHTTDGEYDGFMADGSTPLDGDPTVTVANAVISATSRNGNRLVTATDVNAGTFSIFQDVTGADATYTVDDEVDTATTTITVAFKYHVADTFADRL